MPKPFDVTTKQLVDLNPRDWLQFAGLPGETVETIDADLSTVTTEADRVLRITSPEQYLAHFEFQSSRDPSLLSRTLRYNVLLDVEYGLPVHSVLILLRPEAETSDMTGTLLRHNLAGRAYLAFAYQIVRLWEMPVETALSGGLATLPLAPLGQVEKEDLPRVIAQMQARIEREAAPNEAKNLWMSTYLLLGLKYPDRFINELLKGVQQMTESSTYQYVLAQGRAAGLEQGLEQGVRATILRQGAKRFGPLPPAAETALDNIHSVETLETLAERLLEVESWDELVADAAV